ncbi:unnamed protein product [Acholeplasma phage MV-L51]|uniref:Uncharacterized protein n=1 Tax=Acholeplasma phage MV-L51 TaxID=1977403 RepID=Q04392_9VIRU|nr:hypothetical protein L1_2 [Acholeplasma phage MV-L51]CAA41649.1 unnamed protein product [Acholeplasma phage MV-L51]
MKKILFSIIAIFTLLITIKGVHAYDTGSNVLTNNAYTVTYTSEPLGILAKQSKYQYHSMATQSAMIHWLLMVYIAVGYIYDTSTSYSGIGQGYSPQVTQTDRAIYYQGQLKINTTNIKTSKRVKDIHNQIKQTQPYNYITFTTQKQTTSTKQYQQSKQQYQSY